MATVPTLTAPAPVVTVDEPSSGGVFSFLTDNAISSIISDTYQNLSERRKLMGLSNPGSVERIASEVQRDVLLTNHMFSGLRCDLQKFFSISPMFRLQHGFAMGSNVLPPWQLLAMYGNSRVCSGLFIASPCANHASRCYFKVHFRATSRYQQWAT